VLHVSARESDQPASTDTEPPRSEEKPRQQQADPPGAELRQRLDQVGTILAKGLDLAEAGVSLGVTIISRVGVAASQKIREGMDAAASANAAPAASDAGTQTRTQPVAIAEPATEPEAAFGITNRLPLTPGGSFKISFSVNNDSMTEPKKVELRVEGFTGDATGARLDASAFAVKPALKTIAPVDFEKFALQGAIPADVQSDVYRGAVTVASDSELRIPVVLVVMPL
jgi:hypothetical protein